MMISRRELLRASAAIVAARALNACGASGLKAILAGTSKAPVIWLQGLGCNGDSVSLLNSIHYTTADNLLLNLVDMKYHPTLMAAAGELAVSAAEEVQAGSGHVLVVEGSIPTGADGKYCMIWPGMSMRDAVIAFSQNAAFVLAVGTCAAYGGMTAGKPNPTSATGVTGVLGNLDKIINIPGCPAHPDWIVGTVAYLLGKGEAPPLDAHRRPLMYFGKRIHDYCEHRHVHCNGNRKEAGMLSLSGCLLQLGCKGPASYADCYMRKFNAAAKGRNGVNWCIGARSPCIGCVQPEFPDGMSPFFQKNTEVVPD